MPRLTIETKQQIKELSKAELEKIVLKMAAKDSHFFNSLKVNYLDKEGGEQELFEQTKLDINYLYTKRHKGFSDELRMANMLAACIKRINEFTKISKNKLLEAELLLYILEETFTYPINYFGTCFTAYDSKVGIIGQRLINVLKKVHPNYLIEYQEKINRYLGVLHRNSNHIDTIYKLPN
ncbi:MAG: hypothetical protein PF541_14370 [Prolixibacteraceae bacterium]|jgi:hypothetical protein|nr:hypothetical protein [Prolixibacteraceae bacterium]